MILVTGGLGFIGVHTVRALLDRGEGCVVTRWDREPGPDYLPLLTGDQGAGIAVETVDVADREALLAIGRHHEITAIVHLAVPGIGVLELFEDFRTTVSGLINVLEAAHEWKAPRVVLASSITVYWGVTDLPLREEVPLPVASAGSYAAVKKATEVLSAGVAQDAGLEVVNARIAPAWGPLYHSMQQLIPRMVHAAVRGEPTYFAPPRRPAYAEDSIDMAYVKDIAAGLALLATTPALPHRTYNVGSGRPTPKREIIAAIRAVIPDVAFDVLPGHDPEGKLDTAMFYGDITRIATDTGYSPAYDIHAGVADYIAWLRSGHDY